MNAYVNTPPKYSIIHIKVGADKSHKPVIMQWVRVVEYGGSSVLRSALKSTATDFYVRT